MRRRILAALTALALTACTPGQLAHWWELRQSDPALAEQIANDYLNLRLELTTGRPCAQWYDVALEQGWDPDQWPTLSRIMWRESNCQPGAYNPSGASGLMQVVRFWADDCGGVPADLFNPAFNLACALHVLDVSGWQAWSTYP